MAGKKPIGKYLGAMLNPAFLLTMNEKEKRDMLPYIVSAGGGGIGAKLGMGLQRTQTAEDMSKASTEEWREKRGAPTFEVPASVDQYIRRMNLMSRQEMPGYDLLKGDIQESTAMGLGQVGQIAQGEDKMAGLLGLMQGQRQSLRTLGVSAMQYQYGSRMGAAQAGLQRAPWEEKQFEYNQWAPWGIKQNEQMGMYNTGNQMMSGAMDQAMSFGIQGANLAAQNQWYNNMNPQMQQYGAPPTGGSMNPNWNPSVPSGYGQYNAPYSPSPYFTG